MLILKFLFSQAFSIVSILIHNLRSEKPGSFDFFIPSCIDYFDVIIQISLFAGRPCENFQKQVQFSNYQINFHFILFQFEEIVRLLTCFKTTGNFHHQRIVIYIGLKIKI